ncbi:cation:proton antiporter family protein [Corynebacterium sp.]|uniref:cation:proton antiporter family protein n=1 Tax=Corynebacterium sp. TaxID=1720 RepID=UPI0026DB20AA|nr:cation:proton antiporter family protein [Corynebacterium sp.]MDO5077133.1 cation:proton antiporter [Corynebacterium sp.]
MPPELLIASIFAIVGGLGASALRLPPLVGFLAAGFALSTTGVTSLPGIDAVSDLGVTVLLFTIGLHLDPKAIAQVRIVGTTVGHALLTTAAFAVAFAFFGSLSLMGELSWGSYLLLGLAASFSSTVFVMAVLDETGRTRSMVGTIAIGVLVLQDVIAVAFLVGASGRMPETWAAAFLFLPLLRPLLRRLPDQIYRTDLLVLAGVTLAVASYALFELAGLSGSLGSLLAGLIISAHPIAGRMFNALTSVRELLLVGFFINIGLGGVPDLAGFFAAGVLLVLLPIKTLFFVGMLYFSGMSHRTSTLAAGVLSNYSEFGLIVVAIAVQGMLLPAAWLQIMAVAVAGSFVLCSLAKLQVGRIMQTVVPWVPELPVERLARGERPLDVEGVDALVLGMGRVGVGAYRRLQEKYSMNVAGVEFDADRVETLRDRGFTVFQGDATDPELWMRVQARERHPGLIVLAMPEHSANVDALRVLETVDEHFVTAALAKYSNTTAELVSLGVDATLNLYDGAGTELADVAFKAYAECSHATTLESQSSPME